MPCYSPHELAKLFPPMADDQFAELVADIKEHGLREPIVLRDGKILDGINRNRACAEAGVACEFTEWEPRHKDDTPLAYVISVNLKRRMLTDSQRSIIAARLVSHPGGRPKAKLVTRGEAAALLNVSKSRVRMARRVIAEAAAEEVAAVERGDKLIGQAYRTVRKDTQSLEKHEKPLPITIREWLDKIAGRSREIDAMSKATRIELCMDFARVLKLDAGSQS